LERQRWGRLFGLAGEQLDFFELHEAADIEHSDLGWQAVARFAARYGMEEAAGKGCEINLRGGELYLTGIAQARAREGARALGALRHRHEGGLDVVGGAKLADDRKEGIEHRRLRGRPPVEERHADVGDEVHGAEEQNLFRGIAARLALDGDAIRLQLDQHTV